MSDVMIKEFDALVESIVAQRKVCDDIGDKLTEENKKLAVLEAQATKYLKDLNRTSYPSPHGTFYIIQKWQVSTPKDLESKKKFFEYLKNKGVFEQYATVNYNSLNSFYKAEMEIAKKEGNFDFEVPGIGPATLYESVGLKKKG